MILPAPAKLNLFLHITGRRQDGYHELQSVMQFVELADVLSFELLDTHVIHFESQYREVAIEDNLVYRAARLLQQYAGVTQGARITLHKNIPVAAGLGGGSSDAATTLLGLNQLWHTGVAVDVLALLGVSLGADVPFFVRGHAAWAEGVGEQLTPLILPELWYVLAIPNCTVATRELFQDPQLTRDCPPLRIQDYSFGEGDNVFTAPVCNRYPQVAAALQWLGQFGRACMTGSGGVVFAAFDTEAKAGKIAAQAPDGLQCVVSKACNLSPLWKTLRQ